MTNILLSLLDRIVYLRHAATDRGEQREDQPRMFIHIWYQEETAITQSSTIHVMDAMNLLAAIHVAYELSKLERIVTDIRGSR